MMAAQGDDLAGAVITAAELLAALTAKGFAAEVEHTGGNVATLYGPRIPAGDNRALVIAGPGNYNWSDPATSTFTFDELWVGPDDDGDTDPIAATSIEEFVSAWATTLGFTTPTVALEWPAMFDALAGAEGWGLFDTCGAEGHAPVELQAFDDDCQFDTDGQAWAHVIRLACAGSAFHLHTLCYLGQEAPAELEGMFEQFDWQATR